MKKLLMLLLCISLILSWGISVSAAGTTNVQFSADDSEVKPGDKFTIEINISSSDVCTSLGLSLDYDASVFELVKGKCGLKGATLGFYDEGRGFVYLYSDGITPEGLLGSVTVKVRENAAAGVYEISGQFAANNVDEKITASVTGTSITVAGNSAKQETELTDPTQEQNLQEQPVQSGVTQAPEGEMDTTIQNAAPETVEKPTAQTNNAAVDKKLDTEIGTTGSYTSWVELAIAIAVLVVLCAALVICLIRFFKRKTK